MYTSYCITKHHQTKCSSLNADANVKPLYDFLDDFLSVINHQQFNTQKCSNKTASSIKIEVK